MPREITAKKVVRFGSIILLFVVVVGYGIWISRDVLFGIRLRVTGVTDGLTVKESLLSLEGNAKHASSVTLDGRIIPIAQNGAWTDTIALLPGYNMITIGATDRFGRTEKQEYRVYYDSPKALPTPVETAPMEPVPPSTPENGSAVQ